MPTSRNQQVETHILTVDVEDWFHLLEVKGGYSHSEWETLPSRVVANSERLLSLFEEYRLQATFFFIGWVAERNRDLVRRIADAGHEVGSHSYWHELVARHDRTSFRKDLERSRKVLEDITGAPVRGFRAPGFSITPGTTWAFDLIIEQGFTYDSSLWPGRSMYGGFSTPLDGPHLLRAGAGDLIEIPASTRVFGLPLPYSGGGYLRLLPEWVIRSCNRANSRRGIPTALYVHPRDFDARQPRIQLPAVRTFRSYVGLASAERKLRGVLKRFQWTSAAVWIDKHGESARGRVLDVRGEAAATASGADAEYSPPPPTGTVRPQTWRWRSASPSLASVARLRGDRADAQPGPGRAGRS